MPDIGFLLKKRIVKLKDLSQNAQLKACHKAKPVETKQKLVNLKRVGNFKSILLVHLFRLFSSKQFSFYKFLALCICQKNQ